MKTTLLLILAAAAFCQAETVLQDGTKLRVRMEQTVSSATAQKDQEVEMSVSEDVMEGDTVVIAQGARVVGRILEAQSKRRMGRAGKLDFAIEKVRAVDGRYINLRHQPSNEKGKNTKLRTGIMVASIAVFVPAAAPVALLMKGKDVEIQRGRVFDVFTDQRYTLKTNSVVAAR